MKRIIISALLFTVSLTSYAQSNFHKISIGGGIGATQSFTEVRKHDFGLAGYGTLDYLFTPFMSIGLEFQTGEINGGDYYTDPDNRQFVNSYKAYSINGKIALGELMDDQYRGNLNALRGLYLGSGIGMIQNSVVYTVQTDPDDPGFITVLNAPSKDIYFPVNLGINFYLPDGDGFYRYGLNINYQANITVGEGLDGYNDSKFTYHSGKPDIYTSLSIGIRYSFGKLGMSRKTFRRF